MTLRLTHFLITVSTIRIPGQKRQSLFLVTARFKATGNKLIIPKFVFGIQFKDRHKIPEKIKRIIVAREVERYHASIQYESDETPKNGKEQIGIDIDQKVFSTLSNGTTII